jgi:hypothetical protein
MVDFPEGYGFEPGGKAKLMQEEYSVEIGWFDWVGRGWVGYGKRRNRSPWRFEPFGVVYTIQGGPTVKGALRHGAATVVEGTLQQVVTALCTLHRMKGHMK